MTNEEAIKIMESISDDIKDLYDEYPHTVDGGFKLFAIDLSIEALKKQVPKKPNYEKVENIFDAQKRTCSECGDVVMISPMTMKYENYCRYCGKKLKDCDE